MADDIVISNRNLRPVTIESYGECRVLTVSKSQIWDGAELALLRETIRRLIEEELVLRVLGIDIELHQICPQWILWNAVPLA